MERTMLRRYRTHILFHMVSFFPLTFFSSAWPSVALDVFWLHQSGGIA